MSNSAAILNRKIEGAGDLQGVVRTMKAHAASSISQYEKSVIALADYYRAIELGLAASFRAAEPAISSEKTRSKKNGSEKTATGSSKNQNTKTQHTSTKKAIIDHSEVVGAIVFGSDQGLVGQFNQDVSTFAIETLAGLTGKPKVWAVGERVYARLADAGLSMAAALVVPTNVNAIAALVGQLQIEIEAHRATRSTSSVYIFHNQERSDALYEPVAQRLLPLDRQWQRSLACVPWPTTHIPEILCSNAETLRALIREYLFISLYRACAESLSSENASRLAAMLRAEKNIDELLSDLTQESHRLRQSSIDEELFDVVAGYALQNT